MVICGRSMIIACTGLPLHLSQGPNESIYTSSEHRPTSFSTVYHGSLGGGFGGLHSVPVKSIPSREAPIDRSLASLLSTPPIELLSRKHLEPFPISFPSTGPIRVLDLAVLDELDLVFVDALVRARLPLSKGRSVGTQAQMMPMSTSRIVQMSVSTSTTVIIG